jgi:phenylacetate-CoA ligase
MSGAVLGPVAVVCHFPPPPGGMPGQAALLAAKLRLEGVAVRPVRTNLGAGRLALFLDGRRGLRTLLRVPLFLLRLAWTLPRVRVVHVFSHSGLGFVLFTAPAVWLGRLLGCRVVANYHGGAAAAFLARFGRLAVPVLRRAHAVTVPSAYLQGVFAAVGVAASVVPNIAEVERFAYREDRNASRTLLVARHLEPIYNVACAVRAFARLHAEMPDARLVVLGDGSQRDELAALAGRLGVGASVEFAGYVRGVELLRGFDRASVLLNTSNVDNVPMAILEAYAAGVPVVSTRAGGIPSIVTDGATGFLVELDDDAAAADRVRRLLADQDLANRVAREGRRVALAHQWSAVFAELRRAYGIA